MQVDQSVLLDATGRIRGRWTLHIVHALLDGATGFNELRRAVPGAGPSTLARRLAELEAAGIVDRTVIESTPPGTRYTLTPFGEGLRPVLAEMATWGADREPGERHDEAAAVLALFQERWMLELHCALLVGPRRFGELAHEMGVNQVTLTQRLGDLERRGLVHRLGDAPGSPYAFTPSGEGFNRVGEALAHWATTAPDPSPQDQPSASRSPQDRPAVSRRG